MLTSGAEAETVRQAMDEDGANLTGALRDEPKCLRRPKFRKLGALVGLVVGVFGRKGDALLSLCLRSRSRARVSPAPGTPVACRHTLLISRPETWLLARVVGDSRNPYSERERRVKTPFWRVNADAVANTRGTSLSVFDFLRICLHFVCQMSQPCSGRTIWPLYIE
jgi:hypothetical protein